MLLGHTKQINGVWKIQSLKQHSENVAEYCARACQPLGLENLGRLNQSFQRRNAVAMGKLWRRNSFTTFSLDCANGSIGNRIPSL